jgi:hypothetical protein
MRTLFIIACLIGGCCLLADDPIATGALLTHRALVKAHAGVARARDVAKSELEATRRELEKGKDK